MGWARHAAIILSLSLRGWAGGTVYVDGPSATDAQRIATQMLNDAASGRWRGNDFRRPSNPFDQMIADYERRQRERALELEGAAVRARERLAEMAAESERLREEQARDERAERVRVRIDALNREAEDLRPMAHVRLGMLIEAGRYEPGQLTFPRGMTATTYARARYEQAAKLDLPLGEVAMAFIDRGDQPRFPALWDALQALPDGPAMRALLERHASGGHVGAAFWLGMWAAGHDVGLGSFPALPGGANRRGYALQWLGRADPERLGAWYADQLLQGDPAPTDRARAMALLESLAVPGERGDAHASIVLARELLRQARVEADMVRPRGLLAVFRDVDIVPGMHALAAMHLDGTDGLFRPGEAARVYARMPGKPRFLALRGAGEVYAGLDALFGVERSRDVGAARARLDAAAKILEGARGVYRAGDAGLKVETALWQAFALAEAGESGKGGSDPVEFLMVHGDAGGGLGSLLSRCAELGRTSTLPVRAEVIWEMIRGESPFTAPASPAEMWVLLQCAIRAHERGGAPDLAGWVTEAKDLRPREVPVRGAMLLARLAFSKGPLVRDSADRRGLPHAYGALVRAAWRDPALWAETAALLEVMQVDPLEPDQWKAGWLGSWMEVEGAPGDKARAWAALLMRPDSSKWRAAHGPGWAPELESLSLRPAGQLPAPVAALRASLRLRAAEGGAGVERAFRALVSLGGDGHWHAQALLEDFAARYHDAYARRGEGAVFAAHARTAAELVAGWRATGFGFCRRNSEQRWKAVGRAIEAGSTQFNRAELEKAARDGSEAAQVAIHRLDAMASVSRGSGK